MTASKQSQDETAEQFNPDSAWKHATYQSGVYSRKLLKMGREH
jgi:hypothetical protein